MPLRFLESFARRADRVADLAGAIACGLLFVCIVAGAGNALAGKFLGVSTNAWLEVQWHLFAAAVLLGAAYTLKTRGHIRLDDIRQRLSERGRDTVELAFLAVIIIPVAGVVVVTAFPFLARSLGLAVSFDHGVSIIRFAGAEMSRNPHGIAVWPAKAWIVVGFGLVLLQATSEVCKLLIRRASAPPTDTTS